MSSLLCVLRDVVIVAKAAAFERASAHRLFYDPFLATMRQMKVRSVLLLPLLGLLTLPGGCAIDSTSVAGEPPARPADRRDPLALIRDEGMHRSEIPETAEYLCNVIGPRLTASPALRQANEWTRDRLAAWGLANSHLEPWGPFGRGWSCSRFSLNVITPYAFTVTACPKAWSTGFDRPLEASIVYLDTKTEAGLAAYKDRVRGAIVLIGAPHAPEPPFEPQATRLDDRQLKTMAALPANEKSAAELMQSAATTLPAAANPPGPIVPIDFAAQAFAEEAFKFAARNGAAAVLTPSYGGGDNTLFVAQAILPDELPRRGPDGATTRPGSWWPDAGSSPAQAVIGVDDFNRLVSLSRHGVPATATMDLCVKFTDDLPQQFNTIAEIPGTDLADQIVMIGAHLDSWHAATGATDNAAGVVATMEAVRLIRAAGLHPRRTVRIALWTGEEQGLLGSIAYAKDHFGHLQNPSPPPVTQPSTRPTPNPAEPLAVPDVPATQPVTRRVNGPDYDKLCAYFNLDNGTGRIRGLYAQNDTAAIPQFQDWLKPLHDLGATTVSPANTYATDHISFARLGLPAFAFIQDPIDYFTRTHHSNLDTYDRLQIDDLKQASVVMATVLWNAANTDEMLPRKAMTP